MQARLGQTWVGSWFAQVICPLVCERQPTAVPPQALPGTLCGKCSADTWCLGVCHVPLHSAVWPPSLPWVHPHSGAALSILLRTLEAAVLGVPPVQGQPLPLDVPTALHWPSLQRLPAVPSQWLKPRAEPLEEASAEGLPGHLAWAHVDRHRAEDSPCSTHMVSEPPGGSGECSGGPSRVFGGC